MTGWDRDYLANKDEYLKLFDNVMQKENERNIEFLEKKIQKLINRKYVIACASGTDALQYALMAYAIKPGDEVLVTNFSWISSASCVAMNGATTVFCDVDPKTNHMSIDSIKRMYSDKTKAIVYPHLFGNISDMTEIQNFCEEKNIPLIEDACQSFGASRNGQQAGTFGDIATLSFNANKPVAGISGGGAILLDQKGKAEFLKKVTKRKSYPNTLIITMIPISPPMIIGISDLPVVLIMIILMLLNLTKYQLSIQELITGKRMELNYKMAKLSDVI